ncbi:hypothetical protein WAI453_010857 [Rhynchosporium graminicola]|uniref:tRNA-splicing endonuclease subunit Sen34 n=1 Tax=Rhynchosporium graminicola TaxID=2792576 RepID=A0A1E1L9B7_9HELO|nr:related to tRNA splicing endonuclease gamma subunit [Rhynchosporium commune]
MAWSSDFVTEPVPISLIAGRYLLFDVNVVTYLRRNHHICGTLTGSLPQSPQQNVFFGLPMQLMPEDAKLLVEKEVAYIVDDRVWHKQNLLTTLQGADKQAYIESLRSTGMKARKAALSEAKKKTEVGLARYAARKAQENAAAAGKDTPENASPDTSFNEASSVADDSSSLFEDESNKSERLSTTTKSPTVNAFAVTPTTSYPTSSQPQNPSQQLKPTVSSSYALFAHLHSRDYYIMPGLRFGCNYNVYPGDPLRFHSHFLATGYDYDQDIPMFDIIGGGRLGTSVKKGFMMGGEVREAEGTATRGDKVRTFCIEWGGM